MNTPKASGQPLSARPGILPVMNLGFVLEEPHGGKRGGERQTVLVKSCRAGPEEMSVAIISFVAFVLIFRHFNQACA